MAQLNIPGKVLSHNEDKALRERASDLGQIVAGAEVVQGVNHEVKNKEALVKEIHKIEATLAAQSAAEMSLSPAERDQVKKEEELLRFELQKDMPTWKDYWGLRPQDGGRYHALVAKIRAWESDPLRRGKVKRWQNLRRIIDPHDPKFSSTTHLFL